MYTHEILWGFCVTNTKMNYITYVSIGYCKQVNTKDLDAWAVEQLVVGQLVVYCFCLPGVSVNYNVSNR